jgi:alpha-tubulin suppressor-like RCC1 family protein
VGSHDTALLDLPLEVLTEVCQQLDLHDLGPVAAACKRFRHADGRLGTAELQTKSLVVSALEVLTGVCQQLNLHAIARVAEVFTRFCRGDGELERVDLPTQSPVIMALRERAFPGGVGILSTRPIGCSESWVAYLARCTRQRRFWEAPCIAAGFQCSLFVDAAGRLLACGEGAAVGHGDEAVKYSRPTPVIAMAGLRMRSVAAGACHSLALGWDGRVYPWGIHEQGQLGHIDTLINPSPAPVEGLESVRSIAASHLHSLAVTQSEAVFQWGPALLPDSDPEDSLRPVIVEGFGGVRVRRVFAGTFVLFAIGGDGELFSWGRGVCGLLGHGDTQDQPSPKRVEALRGVRVSSASLGWHHALALAEDGLVYAWGENEQRAVLGNPNVERELLPKPVEALRRVRVGSLAAAYRRSYAVTDTGKVWAWGVKGKYEAPIGHGEQVHCPLPKPIESLRGVKVDAVIASQLYTLALADDGSVYAWGCPHGAASAALGLGTSVSGAGGCVPTPQRIPELRVAAGL